MIIRKTLDQSIVIANLGHFVRCAFATCLFLLPSAIEAKDNVRFDRVDIRPGFSKQPVTAIVQDIDGYMWFGTRNGIYLYDGNSFTPHTHDPFSTDSISNNVIRFLSDASGSHIWVISDSANIDLLNTVTGRSSHYSLPGDTGDAKNQVLFAYCDDNRDFWVSGTLGGLFKFNKEKDRFERTTGGKADGIDLGRARILQITAADEDRLWLSVEGVGPVRFLKSDNSTVHFNTISRNSYDYPILGDSWLYEDDESILWVETWGEGLYALNLATGDFRAVDVKTSNASGEGTEFITHIMEDSDGYLWTASLNSGLTIINKETQEARQYNHSGSNPHSLISNSIEALYQDTSGSIWIATLEGLCKYSKFKYKFTHALSSDSNTREDSKNVQKIYKDHDENIWVSTIEKGLFVLDNGNGELRPVPIAIDGRKTNTSVTALCQDNNGSYYFGTGSDGLLKYDAQQAEFTPITGPQNISDIYIDDDGTLWIATYINGLGTKLPSQDTFIYWKPNTVNGNFDATVIFKDSAGNLWIGSDGNGVVKLFPDRKRFVHLKHDSANPASLSDNRILTINQDNRGYIWIGTRYGLNRLHPETYEMRRFFERNLLPDNTICSILRDETGLLWISTYNGLARLNPANEEIITYRAEDGLQDNRFNPGCGFRDQSGKLYFGGVNGFNSFIPAELPYNPIPPPVVITAFRKLGNLMEFEEKINDLQEIRLNFNENFFSFEFSALDYTNPARNSFEYKLEGIDQSWINIGNRRYASYTNISPGEYRFFVRAANSDGVWSSEATSVSIKIVPPFWMTWEFRTFLGIAVLAAAFSAYQLRIRAIKRQRDLLEVEVAERRLAEGKLLANQARLREMAMRLTLAEESERRKFAGSLHDRVGHSLFHMKVKISEQEKGNPEDELTNWLEEFKLLVDDTIEETRTLTVEISPPSLHKFGLESAMERLVERFGKENNIKTLITKKSRGPVTHEIAVLLYQSLRELLMNIAKHAHADIVHVTISNDGNVITVKLRDNGTGFDTNTMLEGKKDDSTGYGIFSIIQRLESIGGKCEIRSNSGEGTEVTLTAPLSQKY